MKDLNKKVNSIKLTVTNNNISAKPTLINNKFELKQKKRILSYDFKV